MGRAIVASSFRHRDEVATIHLKVMRGWLRTRSKKLSSQGNNSMLQIDEVELPFLTQILSDPANMEAREVYRDWLYEQSDPRSALLQRFLDAVQTMKPDGFEGEIDCDPVWLDLIGWTLMKLLSEKPDALKNRDAVLASVSAGIRVETVATQEAMISVGESKYGGDPDLPANQDWPTGEFCSAIYNDDTKGIEEPAGFVMQINLGQLQSSPLVELPLPKSGLLSIFAYQSDKNVDCIGAGCVHVTSDDLTRRPAPETLNESNQVIPAKKVIFHECLRVPTAFETDDAALSDLLWDLCQPTLNQVFYEFRDFQTEYPHFLGVDTGNASLFLNISPDVKRVGLDWVVFGGGSGLQ